MCPDKWIDLKKEAANPDNYDSEYESRDFADHP